MGAARKLQAEIDRTLKRVQDGIMEFDEIWDKVYEAENHSQREKHENDLKKEIKKLQRFRDQIKTWINGSEIKDKSALMEARRNIEKKMEQFKNCEKEAKTKAFSKAGLDQAAKMDPEEKARQATREWLNEQMETLQMQIDEFESELEALTNSRRGKQSLDRQEVLEECVVRHQGHITRLEQCMRCLDNATLTYHEIDELRDLVEYYVNENQEDDLGYTTVDENYSTVLDRLNDVARGLQNVNVVAKVKKVEEEREKERAAAAAVKATLQTHSNNTIPLSSEEDKKSTLKSALSSTGSKKSLTETTSENHSINEECQSESSGVQGGSAAPNGSLSFASATAGRNSSSLTQQQSTTATTDLQTEDEEFPKLPVLTEKQNEKSRLQDDQNSGPSSSVEAPPPPQLPVNGDSPVQLDSDEASNGGHLDPKLAVMSLEQLTSDLSIKIGALKGVTITPSQFEGNPAASLQLLKSCNRGALPQPIDGDYHIRLAHNTSRLMTQQLPASYPVHRLPQLEDPSFYRQLDREGLFYAFYFHPEDITQFCAAKELKRQSWKFHLEHKFWFQAKTDPSSSTSDQTEEGVCTYFDRALSSSALPGDSSVDGWCYRTIDNFMFTRDQAEDDTH